jgi:hypothetical protein
MKVKTGLTLYPLTLKNFKPDETDGIGYQQVYQCLKIIVPNFSES